MGRKLTRFVVSCNRDWCDYEREMAAHVVPDRIWHEYGPHGEGEQHLCNVEVQEEDE